MISHTSAYKDIITAPVKTVRVKFYIHDNSNDSDTPIWEDDANAISSTALGQFNNSGAQKISAKIVGNQINQLNQLLRVDMEAKTDSDWEGITLGYYTVYQVAYDVDSNISTIDLYDPMYMLSLAPYALPDNTFPCTVTELAETLATFGALDLDPDFASLPNADFTIMVNLWATIQNTTYRDVVNEIAQATGTTAITSGKTLAFKTYTVAEEGLSEPNLIKFQLGQKWGNVNSVTLSRQPQNDNILLRDEDDAALNGVFEVEIDNNQIMDNNRETMIQPLYDYFVGDTPYLNYYNATLITEGHGWYEVGDVIIATLNGEEYPILITEVDLTIDGGITETIKSIIPTNPSVNNTTSGGILKTLWDTEIKVDKQGNTITSIVSQQQIFQDYVNDNFTQIQQDIDNVTIAVQDGGGVNQIKNSVGYSLDNDHNLNFWEYIS